MLTTSSQKFGKGLKHISDPLDAVSQDKGWTLNVNRAANGRGNNYSQGGGRGCTLNVEETWTGLQIAEIFLWNYIDTCEKQKLQQAISQDNPSQG